MELGLREKCPVSDLLTFPSHVISGPVWSGVLRCYTV
jgi:hypothetical protein